MSVGPFICPVLFSINEYDRFWGKKVIKWHYHQWNYQWRWSCHIWCSLAVLVTGPLIFPLNPATFSSSTSSSTFISSTKTIRRNLVCRYVCWSVRPSQVIFEPQKTLFREQKVVNDIIRNDTMSGTEVLLPSASLLGQTLYFDRLNGGQVMQSSDLTEKNIFSFAAPDFC